MPDLTSVVVDELTTPPDVRLRRRDAFSHSFECVHRLDVGRSLDASIMKRRS